MHSDVLVNYPDACELFHMVRKGQSANEIFDVLRTVNNRFLTPSLRSVMRSLSVLINCNMTNELPFKYSKRNFKGCGLNSFKIFLSEVKVQGMNSVLQTKG